ncbi:MAG: shikimate dehydrogenase [Saprospiraceae bacterium]|jgi:shikimate dehydrogenase
MNLFGLIGYPLSHSFSKKYFTQKFEQEGIADCQYELFPLEAVNHFPALLEAHPNLVGLNVTIPYKEQIIPYLDELEKSAAEIGAVNTIKIKNGKLSGFNTDVFGFETSLKNFVKNNNLKAISKALVLGTGGASKAVTFVLKHLGIEYAMVSRDIKKGDLQYKDLDQSILRDTQLIVNTTPLGTAPGIDSFPDIPYELLNNEHLLFDLVYNPEKTVFLIKGKRMGAHILNGLEMLRGQAEKSWEIWTEE